MEKEILLIVLYFTLAGPGVHAQNKKTVPPPEPPAPIERFAAPPPPPVPPIPPPPPAPTEYVEFSAPVIINSNGYEISVKEIKGIPIVFLKKEPVTQKVRLSTWNANRKFYEKKYGQLPPPPPGSE